MSIELKNLTLIEKELRFGQWCNKEGIKRFLFDLDDTICPTRSIFRTVMPQAYDFLAENVPSIARDTWKEEIVLTNNRLFEIHAVNPNRWDKVVEEIGNKYHLNEQIKQRTKDIFQTIYKTPLTMLEGAEEGLKFIKKVGVPMGIITHAGSPWTLQKYNWLDLKRFLGWDEVFVVDENRHKTRESWMECVSYFRLNPKECAAVGDSPRSDINPAMSIGIKNCFLVEDPDQWTVHKEPVDSSVRIIKNLAQIPSVVLEENL